MLYVVPPNLMRRQIVGMLYPVKSMDIDKYIKIIPGNASLPRGEDIHITMKMLVEDQHKPVLYARSEDLDWSRIKLMKTDFSIETREKSWR